MNKVQGSKAFRWVLGGVGVFFILCSLIITLVEYNQFTDQPVLFPAGSRIAGIPVDGLEVPAAQARLAEFFALPLVLTIEGSTIHADPAILGFTFDPAAMVAEAASQIEPGRFWAFLQGQAGLAAPVEVPLTAGVDDEQIRTYLLNEIEPRYTQPSTPTVPIPNTTNFIPGEPGQNLRIDQAVTEIRAALLSPELHQVSLALAEEEQPPASFEMLAAFLRHNMDWIGFNDLLEVYLQSMGSRQSLHYAIRGGDLLTPDIAFTAASTIKIPIMISVLRRTAATTPEAVVTLLERMIAFSENPPADTLMSTYLDEVRGPLIVSEDLAALGMENTFLAGFFYLGAPLLQLYETPANSRNDIFLDPDIYNQTVPSEAGRLLAAIYTCAEDGSGLLTETFPGEITQAECQLMVDVLAGNRIGLLIEAGLPPEARVAHKHGWVQELDGQLRSMSDVAIVFTPGGDYVLNIFLYDSSRLDFDQGNRLFARLSQTVYNFFNLDDQAHWWFD
jgi:hypothetical protein